MHNIYTYSLLSHLKYLNVFWETANGSISDLTLSILFPPARILLDSSESLDGIPVADRVNTYL